MRVRVGGKTGNADGLRLVLGRRMGAAANWLWQKVIAVKISLTQLCAALQK